MSKLVRDRTPEFLQRKGTHIEFHTAPEEQRHVLLLGKLLEEAGEWLAASGREARLKELGDLTEIIWAMGEADGIDRTEILMQAHGKREARGSFDLLRTMNVELGSDKPSVTQRILTRADASYGRGDGPWYSG